MDKYTHMTQLKPKRQMKEGAKEKPPLHRAAGADTKKEKSLAGGASALRLTRSIRTTDGHSGSAVGIQSNTGSFKRAA